MDGKPIRSAKLARALAGALICWAVGLFPDSGSAAESPLLAYFEVAAEENPGLRAAHEEWTASVRESQRVESLPDPSLRYGYFIESIETALGPQEHRIGVVQRFPWFGKLGFRGDAAAHTADATGQRYRAARFDVLRRVARAYYELAYLEQAIVVTKQNLEYVQYQERVARARYRIGAAGHPDVIRAQVELGVLEDRLRTLEDRRGPRVAALNESLGRTPRAPLPFPVVLVDAPLEVPDDSVAIEMVLSQNPDLLALNHAVEARESQIDAARRDRYPDLTVGVETVLIGRSELTSFDASGRDAWMASVSINVPLWRGKYAAAVDQAEARHRSAEARRADARNRMQAMAEDALYRLRDAQRKIELYRDSLIPKGEESLRATSTAFQTGDSSFLDFIDAQRSLLQFELELARAEADRGQTSVEILALMGALPAGSPSTGPKEGS